MAMHGPFTRHLTTHAASDKSGGAVSVSSAVVPLTSALGGGAAFTPLFSLVSPSLPLPSSHHITPAAVDASVRSAEGKVVTDSGVNAQVTDLAPDFLVGMHRTHSVDFNVFLAGSAYLITPIEDAPPASDYPSPGSTDSDRSDIPAGGGGAGVESESGVTYGQMDGMKVQKRLVRAGEIVIQNGTLHAWHAGPDGARWVTVVAAAEPVCVGGKPLPEVDFQ